MRSLIPIFAALGVFAAALSLAPVSAQAQSNDNLEQPSQMEPDIIEAPSSGRVLYDAESFRDAYVGSTMHLRRADTGSYYGSEEFLPGDRSVWAFQGQQCEDGVWTYNTEGQFCFTYPGSGPHCWYLFEENGAVFAETADGGLLLEVYLIDDEPLPCRPDRMS